MDLDEQAVNSTDSILHGWMQHIVDANIPPEDFPTSAAPIIYEGFVPQNDQPDSEYPPIESTPDDVRQEPNVVISETPRRRGRGGRRGRGRTRGRGGWNRGTKTGLRPVVDPGEEFNTLHKNATEAWIDRQDHDEALELILRAISINPEIYSAHVLLAEIYFARNDDERALAALFSGAHASPNDPDVWHQLADICLQRASADRPALLRQASYCFQRLLQIDREDHDARFQKAAISRELGHHAKALKDLEYLLQKMPHNSSVLRQLAEVCLDINDVGRAIGLYDDALEFHRLGGLADEEAFGWADLIIYVDLVAKVHGLQSSIRTLKDISRQILGRSGETYWQEFEEDDREFDLEDLPRRVDVPAFQPGCFPPEAYGAGLPLEIRIKLGDFRLKTGSRQEALAHFEWLAPEDHTDGAPLYEYSDLFLQVADALREAKDYRQALRFYEALYDVNVCDDVDFWLGLGACSYVCEKRDQALNCYEEAKLADPTSGEARTQLSKLYADKGDRDKALVLAREAITLFEGQIPRSDKRKYERRDLREAREAAQKAYRDAYKIPKLQGDGHDLPAPYFSQRARKRARREEQTNDDVATANLLEVAADEARENSLEPPNQRDNPFDHSRIITRVQRRGLKKEKTVQQRYENIQLLFSTLSGMTELMRKGDDVARNIWMDCAEALVEEFRKQKEFYPSERYVKFKGLDNAYKKATQAPQEQDQSQMREDIPLPSVESSIPQDYCDITFSDWLDIFLEYALILANTQEDKTECYVVINAALDCNVWYHDQNAIFQIHVCWLACAVALHDDVTLFNTVIRWFMREFIFCTDSYRLFAAFNFHFPHQNDKGGKSGQMNNAVFRAGPNQKFLFRQIMALDSQLPEDYGIGHPDGPVPEFMRKPNNEIIYMSDRIQRAHRMQDSGSNQQDRQNLAEFEDENQSAANDAVMSSNTADVPAHRTYSPLELDVVLLTIYAQILYAGNSFPNALSYYYRAYSLDPKNTVVLLSIALCYMHQMLKRQNENRHMYLLQGWSFFEKYAEARIDWARQKEQEGEWVGWLVNIVKREIEFNKARCWQMLGMSDLAIRSYGKMLDIKIVKNEDEMDVDEGTKAEHEEAFSKEAAHAMVNMYAVNGDMESARKITEKYLVLE